MFRGDRDNADKESDDDEKNNDSKAKVLSRYNFNYSKWDQWVPTDEASRAEQEEMKAKEEEEKNKEFEKNNAEFCKNFLDDAAERKKAIVKKQESSDMLRLKGNNFFKAKNYSKAMELYVESLKENPYDVKILTNMAQVHTFLRLGLQNLSGANVSLFVRHPSN
jgi:hypothetical protein